MDKAELGQIYSASLKTIFESMADGEGLSLEEYANKIGTKLAEDTVDYVTKKGEIEVTAGQPLAAPGGAGVTGAWAGKVK
jgi:ribosome maturation protein Sdo1